ncbi:MAG: chromosome segregation SMC family protein [Pseudomonadota bacterium]
MKFEKLRLLGFKSFVEPTEFIIEKGLTGVVGPNGCGKSNLVEALRWVMGESSYKNMRASGMDDVIFSGSATRPSRNMAEVALFLDNKDRTAPASFNDAESLQVARRIERDAGSAYKINGKDARAKDVQLLFADQSTGARSPSMVGQGRIGELIQAKPQARRALLEEAAGISGLHSRRHEAELRLRAAETNLERLDDVVAELESQIESLKRQARQANRFKTLSRDIRSAEAILLHLKWAQAKDAEGEAQSVLSGATASVAASAQTQMQAAKDQAAAQHHLPPLRQKEAEAAAALQRLTIAREQIDAETQRIEARRKEYEERIRQLGLDIEREETMRVENANFLSALNEEEAQLKANESGSAERALELEKARDDSASALAKSEASLAEVTELRAETLALRSQLERRIREASERKARLEAQHEANSSDIASVIAQIAQLPDPQAKANALAEAEQNIHRAEASARQAETVVAKARENEVQLRPVLSQARDILGALEAEARTIAKLLNVEAADLFAPIVESFKVTKGYETALGAALGDDLEVPADPASPVHWAGTGVEESDPKLPDGVEPLSAFVTGADAIERRLNQIGVVADDATGERLSALLHVGQRLVTKEGALWRWDGYRAQADAPSAAALRLAQKNRLAELDAEIVSATKAKTEAENAVIAAETATSDAQKAEIGAREQARAAQAAAQSARQDLAAAERATGELSRKRAVLEEAEQRLGADLKENTTVLTEAQAALAAEPETQTYDTRLSEAQTLVAQDRAKAAEARAAFEGVAREREQRLKRIEAIGRERENWVRRAENAKTQIETLTGRRSDAEEALKLIAGTPEELQIKRRDLVREIEQAEKVRQEAADNLVKAETSAREADKAANDAVTELAQMRESRARAEERLLALTARREDVEARIQEALQCAPHQALAKAELAEGESLPDLIPTEKRLERLKIERERLGAVNLRAEEEQAELIERLETITTERDDVIAAIAELRGGISSLNKEGRERLLSAFEDVQTHFTKLFTHLFGGGTAELQLIESDDPLEAGLEIIARPPGKKPQTMTLLSGGEQALTAMALIFAVFLTNPAPICVLDEVDAPLDDYNVERFCDLMDEMTRQTDTRFVIITHNPITMARMDRLFGVTMAEQGVSQLVSVDLHRAEELREAS